MVSAMCISDERFGSISGPFYRSFYFTRRPQANDFFRVNEDLRTEPTADVRSDDAQFVLRCHTDECRYHETRHVRILGRVPQGELVNTGVIFRQRDTRLYGIRCETIVDNIEFCDVL